MDLQVWILPNTGLDIRARATYYQLVLLQKQANFHECTQMCTYRLEFRKCARGNIITLNLHSSSSDNCVSTVQPQYIYLLWPIVFIPSERKKENTLVSQGGVWLRMQYYA